MILYRRSFKCHLWFYKLQDTHMNLMKKVFQIQSLGKH